MNENTLDTLCELRAELQSHVALLNRLRQALLDGSAVAFDVVIVSAHVCGGLVERLWEALKTPESATPSSAIDPLAEALFASLIAKGMPHPGNSAFRPTVREAARASLEAAKAFREEQAK